jgi:hypothetical protein
MRLNLTDSKSLVEFSSRISSRPTVETLFPLYSTSLWVKDGAPRYVLVFAVLKSRLCLLSSLFAVEYRSRDKRLSPQPSRSTDAPTSTRSSVLKTAGTRLEDEASLVTDGHQAFRSGWPSHYPLCQSSSLAEQAFARAANARHW